MKDLGITKGEWLVDPDESSIVLRNNDIIADAWSYQVDVTEEEIKANANLIADAGNTAQKCGLLPSELLQQRDELLEALEEGKTAWDEGYLVISGNQKQCTDEIEYYDRLERTIDRIKETL